MKIVSNRVSARRHQTPTFGKLFASDTAKSMTGGTHAPSEAEAADARFEDLPDEAIAEALARLPPAELARVRRLSRRCSDVHVPEAERIVAQRIEAVSSSASSSASASSGRSSRAVGSPSASLSARRPQQSSLACAAPSPDPGRPVPRNFSDGGCMRVTSYGENASRGRATLARAAVSGLPTISPDLLTD